jgi:recombinational DNA repair ATPase RecF
LLCCGQALSGEAPPAAGAATRAADELQPAVNTSAPAARSSTATPAPAVAAAKPAAGTRSGAKDRIELDTTQITGNSELPRVLYVVPWKHSDLGDLTGKPANSLLDEVLAPVDRDVFRRQNSYYEALKPDTATRSATAGPEGEK